VDRSKGQQLGLFLSGGATPPGIPKALERSDHQIEVMPKLKHAARRLRRWPAAMLDRSCARHPNRTRSRRRNGLTSRT
jgi:hypothetical protein